ncbi:LysR family transcriptional regulator [Veillonella nakazawae]|uniref:HTH-type transcriptional regulator YwbI n=1 Tax=Veillonella nakazawae TaxID=2682456 RepID=A0ABM7H9S6_9FIRM|nr:LysR family transcriptional regulator [Veillonella nakazawae]BBU33752.1 putative HTH-type transcriptional regulator YwbI [Veillonella nakazawae]
MDIKDIKYISTIVEMASFSKASKKLYISQPALSQSIRRIEAELGVPLFVRNRTKVVPTAAALQIAKEGMPLVGKVEALTQSIINQGSDAAYHVRIGLSQFYGHHMLGKTLKSFQQIEPSWEFHVVEGESHFLEQQICDGLVDVGLFPTPIYSQALESYPVLDEQILLAVSVENKKAIAIADSLMTPNGIHEIAPFGSFPFILIREGLKLRTLVNRLCQAESFVPKAVIGSENLDTCRSLVEDDYGITFLPSTLNSKGDDDKVKFYPLASKLCFRQLVLVARSDRAKRFHCLKWLKLCNNSYKLYRWNVRVLSTVCK